MIRVTYQPLDKTVEAKPGDNLFEKIATLPTNHHPAFMVDPDPTIRSGVEALTVAALAYLEP